MKSILLVKKLLGLVEMTSGLVNASFSLPKWQAVKMIFFAPWTCKEASLLGIPISSHLPTHAPPSLGKCSVLPGCTLFESELEFSEG